MEIEEINNFLKRGDKKSIANKLGYNVRTVSLVLNGHYENASIKLAASLVAEKNKKEIEEAVS